MLMGRSRGRALTWLSLRGHKVVLAKRVATSISRPPEKSTLPPRLSASPPARSMSQYTRPLSMTPLLHISYDDPYITSICGRGLASRLDLVATTSSTPLFDLDQVAPNTPCTPFFHFISINSYSAYSIAPMKPLKPRPISRE